MNNRRRSLFLALVAIAIPSTTVLAADDPREIRIDWATYNPVSMLLKDKGWLERAFAGEGIKIRWVQTLGSNKALEYLNAGSIDFGSTAGAAALVGRINGNPIKSVYVYSKPEWTALVTRKDSSIKAVADLKGKRVALPAVRIRTSSSCVRCRKPGLARGIFIPCCCSIPKAPRP